MRESPPSPPSAWPSHMGLMWDPRREEPGLPVHFPEMHVDQLTPKCFVCFMC